MTGVGTSLGPMEADHPRFADALRALDTGDAETLASLLAAHPDLVRARATSVEPPYDGYFHGATLLHHVAGNPIRGPLADNIVELARILCAAGADTEAGCGGGPAQPGPANGTVMGLVASGAQAHVQGHTEGLIDALLDAGAVLDPDGGMFGTLYHTVEHQGQREVARMLHARGVRADLPIAAGLGMPELVDTFFDAEGRLVPGADEIWRRTVRGGVEATPPETLADALLCAAVNGWPEVVDQLLDRGAPIDTLRRWGALPVTPLHGAAWAGWPEVVTRLLARGADPTIREPSFDATPLGWAHHSARQAAIAAFEAAGVKR